MTRAKAPGRISAADAPMVAALFDPGSRESAIAALRQLDDPVHPGARAAFSHTLERHLCTHLHAFIERLYASGRGSSAMEFDAADSLLRCAENTITALSVSGDAPMGSAEVTEIADDLERAWVQFVADASAHRMYDDLITDLTRKTANMATANAQRQQKADDELLQRFLAWQTPKRALLRTKAGEPLTAAERVKRFKLSKKPFPDRDSRRLSRLLKSGKIPPL